MLPSLEQRNPNPVWLCAPILTDRLFGDILADMIKEFLFSNLQDTPRSSAKEMDKSGNLPLFSEKTYMLSRIEQHSKFDKGLIGLEGTGTSNIYIPEY